MTRIGSDIRAQKILETFTERYLHGNLCNIKTFDLIKLKGDSELGCPGRNFDCDDTNVARAVYVLAFPNAYDGLSMEKFDHRIYRGDTINSFKTLMGTFEEGHAECEDHFNLTPDLCQKIHEFIHTYHTIGNMVPLPNIKTTKTLNLMRSSLWNDFFPLFTHAVKKYLYEEDYHEKFTPLMDANGFAFDRYKGYESGFGEWLEDLLIDGYYGYDQPLIPPLSMRQHIKKGTSSEIYSIIIELFIGHSTSVITDRADKIIKKLKQSYTTNNI